MTKVLNGSSSGTGRLQTRCTKSVGPAIGILRGAGAPEGSNGPLWRLENHRRRTRAHSRRLRRAPKARPRHARAIFAKYRGSASVSHRFLSRLEGRKLGMRRPSAFTQADVRRALRGAVAAGVTPGRIVVTRDGFAIEFGASVSAIAPAADHEDVAVDDDEAALLHEIKQRTAARRMGKVA
jgi:hypothetical protein